MGMTALGTAFWSLFAFNMQDNPNRSLDPYSAIRYKENYFLPSFIFLLAFCFLFVLDVARYTFELTNNHLLNNLMKSVQALMTDLGKLYYLCIPHTDYCVDTIPKHDTENCCS